MLTLERARIEEALENCLSHDAGANDAKGSPGIQEWWNLCGHGVRQSYPFRSLPRLPRRSACAKAG
jgi:hypothetical protein